MTYGFKAFNDGGDVLLSDSTGPINFWQILTSGTAVVGGSNIHANLTCGTVTTFTSTAPNPPLAFVKLTANYALVLRVYGVAGAWKIEVLHRGTAPHLYIFCKPNAYVGAETHGMQIYDASGSIIYDSRIPKRLAVKQVINATSFSSLAAVTLPTWSAAHTEYYDDTGGVFCGSRKEYQARKNLDVNATLVQAATAIAEPIVLLNSFAICEREFQWTLRTIVYDYVFTGAYWECRLEINQTAYFREWCVYRGGASLVGGQIVTGWVPHKTGETYTYNGSYPSPFIGGGSDYSNGSGGNVPYANANYNLNSGQIFVADAADYI